MPSVCVIPVYVEVPDGFERAITTLERVLGRAGYRFHTAAPIAGTLDQTRHVLSDIEAAHIEACALLGHSDEGTGGAEDGVVGRRVAPRHRILLA